MKFFLSLFVLFSVVHDVPVTDYPTLKKNIERRRISFEREWKNADVNSRKRVTNEARQYLFDIITKNIFDQWYGTPWHFYGMTKTPGKGNIACGYFVTTVLSDAGLQIPGDDWAKLASEEFIVKMSGDLKRFRKRPLSEVNAYLKGKGDGLYIVGLDCHTGFVYVKGTVVKFVHSNYYQPETGVMAQDMDSHNPLKNSKYRIFGKILGDRMIENWIVGNRYN